MTEMEKRISYTSGKLSWTDVKVRTKQTAKPFYNLP